MPRLVKIKSQLKQNKNKAFLKTALAILLAFVFAVVGIGFLCTILLKKSTISIAVPIIFVVISLILFITFFILRKNLGILQSGVRGEEATLKILRKLPKEYTILTNPVILNRGITMELDFVVIGKNGVFIVESKNHRGIISGKTSKQNWKQVKHGKNDKVYEKEIGNPVKQSYRQGKRMAEMFKDFDITADIYPIVYFVDEHSELKILDDAELGVEIFNKENKLLDFIQSANGKHTVNSSELAKIIRFFKR
ncbi:MAG: NERD domain-containing protein [Clostridia bacterium]|nr:NERD domain-containing protein [Clostridia bacterium]